MKKRIRTGLSFDVSSHHGASGYDDRRSLRDGEEMKPDVRGEAEELWPQVTTENLLNISHDL